MATLPTLGAPTILSAWLRSAVAILALIASGTAAHADTGEVSLEDLLKRNTIYIRDIKRLPYPVRSTNGPVLLASVDNSSEIRFWFKPSVLAPLGFGRIVLIAKGVPNDARNGTIIWPKASVGHEYGEELHWIYGQ